MTYESIRDNRLCGGNWGYSVYSDYDSVCDVKMKPKVLQFISLIISALALLYLLFINLYRGSFIVSDWLVVAIDLLAKAIIELIILVEK